MSFIRHQWVTGETITAVLLNRIEDAIESLSRSDSDATSADCDALFDDFLQDEDNV